MYLQEEIWNKKEKYSPAYMAYNLSYQVFANLILYLKYLLFNKLTVEKMCKVFNKYDF